MAALAASPRARADSPHIAEARAALDAVRYDDAQRLLVAALHDGGNSPAAVRQIYQLAASTAVVLGDTDSGEQMYRRWLAIEPGAQLPPSVSPKLREPFIAAQAYMAAHGSLTVRATQLSATDVGIDLVADPLQMAKAACGITAQAWSTFDPSGRARLRLPSSNAPVAVCDESGNRLVELQPTPPAVPVPVPVPAPVPLPAVMQPPPGEPPARPILKRWTTWAIPAGVTGLVTLWALLGIVDDSDKLTDDFGGDDPAAVRADRSSKLWVSIIVGPLFIASAIPAVAYYLDEGSAKKARVVPVAAPTANGGMTFGLAGTF